MNVGGSRAELSVQTEDAKKARDKRVEVGQMDKDQPVICTALAGNLQAHTTS